MSSVYYYVVPSLKQIAEPKFSIGNKKHPNYEQKLLDLLKKEGVASKVIESDDPVVEYKEKPNEPDDEAFSCVLVTDKPIPEIVMKTLIYKWDFAISRDTTCYRLAKDSTKVKSKDLTKVVKALAQRSLSHLQDGGSFYFEFSGPLTADHKKKIERVGGVIEPVLLMPSPK